MKRGCVLQKRRLRQNDYESLLRRNRQDLPLRQRNRRDSDKRPRPKRNVHVWRQRKPSVWPLRRS